MHVFFVCDQVAFKVCLQVALVTFKFSLSVNRNHMCPQTVFFYSLVLAQIAWVSHTFMDTCIVFLQRARGIHMVRTYCAGVSCFYILMHN